MRVSSMTAATKWRWQLGKKDVSPNDGNKWRWQLGKKDVSPNGLAIAQAGLPYPKYMYSLQVATARHGWTCSWDNNKPMIHPLSAGGVREVI